MLMQILTHTPAYVWALLAGLVALGLMQSRTRQVSAAQALAMPATMLGLGLWSLAPAFAALPLVALIWVKALALGVAGGRRTPLQAGTAWLPEVRRFLVAGSWIPLAIILFIFMLRYASNVAGVLHPEWRSALAVQGTLALVFGLLSGLLLGRTWSLLRLAGSSPAAATMATHA